MAGTNLENVVLELCKKVEKLEKELDIVKRKLHRSVNYITDNPLKILVDKRQKKIKNCNSIKNGLSSTDIFSVLPINIIRKILYGYLSLKDSISLFISFKSIKESVKAPEMMSYIQKTTKDHKEYTILKTAVTDNSMKCLYCQDNIGFNDKLTNFGLTFHLSKCTAIFVSYNKYVYNFDNYKNET